MSEMIERVARAMCEFSARRSAIHNPSGYDAEFQRLWAGFGGQAYLPMARAAIEAMREPTNEMVAAGKHYAWSDGAYTAEENWRNGHSAAIAAALEEDGS